jgi:small subunit ribosomal protein S7
MNSVNFLKSTLGSKFVNHLMRDGKKAKAEKILLQSLELIKKSTNEEPVKIILQAVENVRPLIEVRSVRIGGTSHQVPVPLRKHRQYSLGIRWIVESARKRNGFIMSEKLFDEFIDAAKNQGSSVRRRVTLHRLAKANRAFSHYRWY